MTTLRKGACGVVAAMLCLGTPLALTGCASSETTPAVFSAKRTVVDSLPSGVKVSGINPSTVHFLGTHGSASYYAAQSKDALVGSCLVSVPVDSVSDWVAACGRQVPLTVTTRGITARLLGEKADDIPAGWSPAGAYLIIKTS